MAFAKLFENGQEQILVKLNSGDNGPEVEFFFEPPNLGICSLSFGFKDSEEGWKEAELFLESMTEEESRQIVQNQKDKLAIFMENSPE